MKPVIPRLAQLLATFAIAATIAAACGDDDTERSTGIEVTATVNAEELGTDAVSNETGTDTDTDTDTDTRSAAFPITITHKFGETTIEATPERVVSVGFAEHDTILALGVIPIGVRDWYGDQPFATWPWASDELGDAEPEVLASAELNFEQIAALRPDLILGISSGMTDADYTTLAAIAPTVAQSGEFVDYGMPWEEQTLMTGSALGRIDKANEVIIETQALLADARSAHPEFEGATASVAFVFQDDPGAYSTTDGRSRLLAALGFVIPSRFDDLAGDAFYFSVSPEELSKIDADVVVWLSSSDDDTDLIRSIPLRPSLGAFAAGGEIVADTLLTGAFSHGSPLSIEYVIENLVPELVLAVDGDPTTTVPSAAAINDEQAGDGAFDVDEQAAADAWAVVFNSEASFDDKKTHLESANELAATIDAYVAAGSALGGITLDPTAVSINESAALVTYDLAFGGTSAYSDLTGEISLIDGNWIVSRDEFCSVMASARTSCP